MLGCFVLLCAVAPVAGGAERAPGGKLDDFHGRPVVPGRMLLRLSPDQAKATADGLSRLGFRFRRAFRVTSSQLWKLPPGMSVAAAAKLARSVPGVQAVEPDYVRTVSRVPNDAAYGNQYAPPKMSLPQAWDITTGSPSVIVAVIDSGIQLSHPDLQGNIFVNTNEIPGDGIDNDGNGFVDDVKGWDFVGPDLDNPIHDSDPSDFLGHGTKVAGVIGAVGNNSAGISGVCWTVRILPLKIGSDSPTLNDLSSVAEIEAIDYAVAMRAKVINASFGGSDYSHAELEAIQRAQEAGVILAAAAGNASKNIDASAEYPASYNLASIVSAAASDNNDNFAGYSNYGAKSVDIAAPGSSVYSTRMTSGYGYASGTSFASPEIAGIAALLRARFPAIGVRELRLMLMEGNDPVSFYDGKCVTRGRADAHKALTGLQPCTDRYAATFPQPVPIPDGDPNGTTHTIAVPDQVTIRDVSVRVNVDHSWMGDVEASVTSPAGTACTLIASHVDDAHGFSYDFDTQWSFRGQSSAGNWTIKVADNGPKDAGTFLGWALEIRSSWLREDVNGDGCVNVLDLIAVRNALGSSPGAEDVDNDGVVNVVDLLKVRNKLGACRK